jgi:hypothetical protein
MANMTPLDAMVHVMPLAVEGQRWRMAASIAERVAPYVHAKMAPQTEDGDAEPVPPIEPMICPHCQHGRLIFIRRLSPQRAMGP